LALRFSVQRRQRQLRIAAALAERGYDFRFVVGDGEHNGNHDGVILPDALRWLWRPRE
jgi:enterochelin esterase family protein